MVVLGLIFIISLESNLPSIETLKDVQLKIPLRIYSSDGKLISEFGEQRRVPVALNDVPANLKNAILATEDHRFYQHRGVDYRALARATFMLLTTGRKMQGASTITMQVARNFFLTPKKTYIRKINEILLSLKIEQNLSKDEILELYLNKIYWGKRAYGISAAANVYYGVELADLTLPQMAMLAGIPQAPSAVNPIHNPQKAKERREHVLERMLEFNFINETQFKNANEAPVNAHYHGRTIELYAPYVAELVRQEMVRKYGLAAYTEGFDVLTTIDSRLQRAAGASLRGGLLNYDKRHGYRGPRTTFDVPRGPLSDADRHDLLVKLEELLDFPELTPGVVTRIHGNNISVLLRTGHEVNVPWASTYWTRYGRGAARVGHVIYVQKHDRYRWQLAQIPKIQGALASIDSNDGAVLAIVGGFDYRLSRFNRATQSERQPGSSFKPFIYAAALADGFTPSTIVHDSPVSIRAGNKIWRPKNWDGRFYGPMPLRKALYMSRNLPTVRTLVNLSVDYVVDFIKRFGFTDEQLPHNFTLALGSGSASPLEMARGYAAFANGGFYVEPYFIKEVKNTLGKVVYAATPDTVPDAPRILSPQTAYMMTSILKDAIIRGTARRALVLKRGDIAGKTGSTNKTIDAWFSGFNRDIVTIVWVGFDSFKPMREYGGSSALPIWINYMREALKDKPESHLPEPEGLVSIAIDPRTGRVIEGDPSKHRNAIFEVFHEQNAPGHYHRANEEHEHENGGDHHHHAQSEAAYEQAQLEPLERHSFDAMQEFYVEEDELNVESLF